MKVRKKPVVVEAWKLDSTQDEKTAPSWVRVAWSNELLDYNYRKSAWVVKTLEGDMFAHDGDYLIKGVHNELYPCYRDIFLETYEEVYDWTD